MTFSHHTRFALLALLMALLAASCATLGKPSDSGEIYNQFTREPEILVRSEPVFLRDLLAALPDSTMRSLAGTLNPNGSAGNSTLLLDRAQADKALSRTRLAVVGISLSGTASGNTAVPVTEIVLEGNFPSILTPLSFALDPAWRRVPGGWKSNGSSLYLHDPKGGYLHFSTEAPLPRKADDPYRFALSPGSKVALRSGMDRVQTDLALYLDAQSRLIAGNPLLKGVELPFDGIMLVGIRTSGSPAQASAFAEYSCSLRVLMKDEETARIYRPLVRLLWMLTSRRLADRGIPLPQDVTVEQQGSAVVIGTINLRMSALLDIATRLASEPL